MWFHWRIWDADLRALQTFQLIKDLVQDFRLTWNIHWCEGPAPADNYCDPSMAAIQVAAQYNSHQTELHLQPLGSQVKYVYMTMSTHLLYLLIHGSILIFDCDLIKPAWRLSFLVIFARTFQMLPLRLGSGIGNACKGEQWIGIHVEWVWWERHVLPDHLWPFGTVRYII